MTSLMKYFTLPYPCFLWVLLYNNNADIIFLLMFGLFFPFSKSLFVGTLFFLLLIEGYLLYRILLFSVKPQHESAVGIHISSPF